MVIGGSLSPPEVHNQSVSSSAASAGGETAHKHSTPLCPLSLRHWPALRNAPPIKALSADSGVTEEGWHQCDSGEKKKKKKRKESEVKEATMTQSSTSPSRYWTITATCSHWAEAERTVGTDPWLNLWRLLPADELIKGTKSDCSAPALPWQGAQAALRCSSKTLAAPSGALSQSQHPHRWPLSKGGLAKWAKPKCSAGSRITELNAQKTTGLGPHAADDSLFKAATVALINESWLHWDENYREASRKDAEDTGRV